MQYMSPDKKDPQTGGQIPTNADSLDQQQMGLFPNALTSREPTNNEFNASTESDDLYKELWYIIKLIILPLLFAGISCLLVLPSIANGEAQETLWPLAITIIIVTLLQGIAVHYTKDVFGAWILCTTGGFVLLLSISTFALFGAGPGLFLVLVLLAFTAYMLLRIIHPVHEGVVDIVLSSGEYKRTLYSGFNLLFPWEKVTHQINVQETHWNCPPQRIQLSQDEDVILRALISYQVIPQTAHLAAIQVENWEESLRDTFIATLQTIATVFTPDDFVNWPQSLREYQSQPHHSVSGSPADDFSESSSAVRASTTIYASLPMLGQHTGVCRSTGSTFAILNWHRTALLQTSILSARQSPSNKLCRKFLHHQNKLHSWSRKMEQLHLSRKPYQPWSRRWN